MAELLMLQGIYPFQLPEVPANNKDILFWDRKPEDQYWERQGPPKNWSKLTSAQQEKWIERETDRCFVSGVWIYIKDKPYWLPPAYYWTLNWWYTTVGYLDFRYNQLLEEYFEIFCENDPWCIATFRFKKRRDGLTTRRMARKVWKAIQTKNGWFGIQSKTGNDAKKVCWKILMTGWKKVPAFFLPEVSGNTDPKTMLELKKPSTRITKSNSNNVFTAGDIFRESQDDDDLNTTIDWRDTTADAYDGQQANELDLDEFGKWVKASAIDALYTYIKSCSLDGVKYGMIHAYTSPPEKNNQGLKDCQEIWDISDYEKIKDVEGFKVYRWFTSALDSWAEAIDKYGFCDRALAKKLIMRERNNAPESKKKAVIRQTPMYIDEIFDSVETNVFMTAEEINNRYKFLLTTNYKDAARTQPKYIFGNFDWKHGLTDTEVVWIPSENQHDFSWSGRWCISYMPTPGTGNIVIPSKKYGKDIILPPDNSEYVIGTDPYDFKRTDSLRPSAGAAVIGKCFDFYDRGGLNSVCAVYNYRTKDPTVFYEDILKGGVFYGAFNNTESRNSKIIDHYEDRGYFDWLLPKDVLDTKKKDIKGSPTTHNMIQEICTLIEAFTANWLQYVWHDMLLLDVKELDPDNTKKSNMAMAFGHMLLGFSKRRRFLRKKRPKLENSHTFGEAIVENFF